jgi:nickel-dependent lactate racemase
VTLTLGGPGQILEPAAVRAFVRERVAGLDLDGKSLCVVIPDGTRQCPVPLLLDAIEKAVRDRARSCTAVIALGTHAPMSEAAIGALVGAPSMPTRNHAWWEDDTFAHVGTLPSELVRELSGGRIHDSIEVRINRLVVESDVTLIVGPVLPHEVIGFSGGNKYLFPGLSGQEMIDVTHWLGALITSSEIIGTLGITPVRALVDAAAELVPGQRHALCVVVDHVSGALESASFGEPRGAWAAAADVAAESHIEYLDAAVRRVLSVIPARYPDLWTGAKGFYKVEPVVADGGEVILYAPHVTEIAAMHPRLSEIGYHCRDFFVAHWDRYRDVPLGEIAHSTHLFGAGTYDATGEHQRVRVTLATSIPEDVVRRANLGYLAPGAVDLERWGADADALVVPDAGEVLYRLREGVPPVIRRGTPRPARP